MQWAALEPRLMRQSRPLPFCPRPFPGEAVESWIWRLGCEFGYTLARFLRAIGCASVDRKDPTQALIQADIPYLASLARLPPEELGAMETIPADWRLRAAPDQPFCGHCWRESQRLYGFAYLQGSWMHAGRISCSQHGSWLFFRSRQAGAPALRSSAPHTVRRLRRRDTSHAQSSDRP